MSGAEFVYECRRKLNNFGGECYLLIGKNIPPIGFFNIIWLDVGTWVGIKSIHDNKITIINIDELIAYY